MRKCAILLLVALPLAGCSHNAYFTGRTSGITGTAKVSGGGGGGDIVINMGPRVYKGRWVYLAQGGGVTIGSAMAFSGTQTGTATGTAYTLPSGGNGSVIATAADGTGLRCNFDYSEWSNAGTGVCQDSHGELYDLQIH